MHELGHSLGLLPAVHAGIDSEQVSYSEYPSVMDYNSPSVEYVFSSGDASTDDFDDWGYLEQYMYIPDLVTMSEYNRDNPYVSG